MNHEFHADAHKDPDRLEREIDEQRREINETLRALEAKFSSRELTNQFMQYFGGPGREWAGHLGNSVKANPLPTLLTAVGVTWLMMCDRTNARGSSHSYATSPYGSTDYRSRDEGMFDGARDAAHTVREKAHEFGDKAAQAGEALGDRAAHMGEALGDKAAHVREALGDKARHAREAFRSRADSFSSHAGDAREGFQHSAASVRDFSHMIKEQPLALGALGIALGALLGAALPRTEKESRVLGSVSERVMEKGKEMAREGYEKASEVAAEVAQAAEDTLVRQAEPGTQQTSPGQTPGLG